MLLLHQTMTACDKNHIKNYLHIDIMSDYSDLPLDIIHNILSYTGKIKLRNGKYMGQIPKTDERYMMIDSIPRYVRYDYDDNTYGLFVWLKTAKAPDYKSKFINITCDFEIREIKYVYCTLLHSVNGARNVVHIIRI